MNNFNTAVLVIDMQEEYIGEKSKYQYSSTELINRINERISEARDNKERVIYIKNKKILRSGVYTSDFVKNLLVVSDLIF